MTEKMTEMTETNELDLDYDLLRKEQQIQNLLDDFDFFVEHLEDEYKKWNYVEERDGKWYFYYHNVCEEDKVYADERLALEALFDYIRMVENDEEDYNLPF